MKIEDKAPVKKKDLQSLLIRLSKEDHRALKLKAVECGKSMQQIFEMVIKEILK